MSSTEQIKLHNVGRAFKKHQVLHDITFSVAKAEIFGLLGPSGSGKTTLVKLIAGIDEATAGEVYVQGQKMPLLSVIPRIGYMAQSDALYSELTAYENLSFFAALFGLKSKRKKQRIAEVMEIVNLSDDLHKQVSRYSGGMKRRLSLAIALLHEPDILILDEPTVGIDPLLRKSIWNRLDQLSQNGTSILLTTHVMDEAEKCHRLGLIREGNLIAIGTPDDLKAEANVSTIEDVFLHHGGVIA